VLLKKHPQTPAKLFNKRDYFANHVAPRGAAFASKKLSAPINALNFKFYGEPDKSFRPPFSKGGSFQRRSLWSPVATGERLSSFKSATEG